MESSSNSTVTYINLLLTYLAVAIYHFYLPFVVLQVNGSTECVVVLMNTANYGANYFMSVPL